jgi:hypothetical protein
MAWPVPSPRWQRAVYLVFAYFAVALLGLRMGLVRENDPIPGLALFAIIQLSLAYACIADSRVRGRPLIRTTRWLTVLFCVYATPFYVLWSRRFWGILVLLIHFVLFWLTFFVSLVCGLILGGTIALLR